MSIIKKEALSQAFSLAIDMYQKDGNLIVKMDISDIDDNGIQVEIEDGQLHVFGTHFDRLVSLPADIDKAGMAYEIGDGILTVIIPKK